MNTPKVPGASTPPQSSYDSPPRAEVIDPNHVQRLREAGEPLFGLGSVYATPAVLKHLESCGYLPNALLGRHVHGDYGDLDEVDRRTNDQAVVDGSRILSAFRLEGAEKIYVITEAADDVGVRRTTTLIFASEY